VCEETKPNHDETRESLPKKKGKHKRTNKGNDTITEELDGGIPKDFLPWAIVSISISNRDKIGVSY